MAFDASQIAHLDREFLPVRAKILEIGSALDRVQRLDDVSTDDPRWQQLIEGLQLLFTEAPDRAEQIQLHFSREYEPNWKEKLGVKAR